MVDPFSTFVGALSILDVSLETCRGLYNASNAYKDAPREFEELQYTIANVESTLRNLRLFTVEFQSSRSARQYQEVLPEAVKDNVHQINEALRELKRLLPDPNAARTTKERSKWVFQKKKVVELGRRLEERQNALNLALQSVAQ